MAIFNKIIYSNLFQKSEKLIGSTKYITFHKILQIYTKLIKKNWKKNHNYFNNFYASQIFSLLLLSTCIYATYWNTEIIYSRGHAVIIEGWDDLKSRVEEKSNK